MESEKNNLLPLTRSELAVMEYLWQMNAESDSEETIRVTAKQILAAVYSESEKSQHGTIQRLLKRLEEKEYIKRDKSIAVHFFEPRGNKNSFLGGQLKALLDQYSEGKLTPMLENLLENESLLESDILQMKKLFNAASISQVQPEETSPPPLKVDSNSTEMNFPTLPNVKGS